MQLIRPLRPLYWPKIIYHLQAILANTSEVYIVGGAVRDAYRGAPLNDVDLACPHDGRPLAKKIANLMNGAYYPLDAERGVGRAIVEFQGEKYVVDVAALRGDLETDLRDRDFSLNAMAVPLADEELNQIYDPCDGILDMQKKRLRQCSETAIAHDPVRALRGIRQSLKYGFYIDPMTRETIKRDGVQLVHSSHERVRDEFFALLGESKPQNGLLALEMVGLLPLIVPEVAHLQAHNRWRYTLLMLEKMDILLKVMSPRRDDNLGANASFGTVVYLLDRYRDIFRPHLSSEYPEERTHRMLLMFVLLMLHADENSHIPAIERARMLKLSNQEIKQIEAVLLHWRLPAQLHQSAPLKVRQVYRFWRTTRVSGIDACILSMVIYLADKGVTVDIDEWTSYLQTMAQLLEGYPNAMNLVPLVSGTDLLEELGMERGPQVGELLEFLREAQAMDEIHTKDEGLSLAKQWLKKF